MATKTTVDTKAAINYVAARERAEGKEITMPEAVNRFLMDIEAGRAEASQRDQFVDGIAKNYGLSKDTVGDTLVAQARKRADAIGGRAERVRALVPRSKAH